MKRPWNGWLWGGFVLVLAGFLSYLPLFVRFPITRDFPWANLLLFCAGGALVSVGVGRAYRQPGIYRGRILGPIFAGVSVLAVALFAYGVFYEVRKLPHASNAPRVGQRAPEFTLNDQDGKPVALAELLRPSGVGSASVRTQGAVLIFYRGYW